MNMPAVGVRAMTEHTLDDSIREIREVHEAMAQEERERPQRLWRDVIVTCREFNNALRLARKEGLEIDLAVHGNLAFSNWLNEGEYD
jgi:hypothetical protein